MSRHQLDEIALRELDLYIENEGSLYAQKKAIFANLQKKAKAGTYNPVLAAKLWAYWVEEGSKRYRKEFGGSPTMFPPHLRNTLAVTLERRYPKGEE